MKNTKRIVESFEEFTSNQDLMGSTSVNREVDVLAMDMLASLEDVGMFPNDYGDNELRLVFKDGSYIYLFFAMPLRDQTNLKSSKLRMFNTRQDEGLAKEFMGEIRNVMRHGDFPYSTIETVIKEFGKEVRMSSTNQMKGFGESEIEKEVEDFLSSLGYIIKDYKRGIAFKMDNPRREFRIGKLLTKYLGNNSSLLQKYMNDLYREGV
jgi:hypothetical protein